MCRPGRDSARRGGLARAAIAVAALYALALQAFLGGMMPMPAHAEGPPCTTAGPAGPDEPASHDRTGCCTPARMPASDLPARADAMAAAWPARVAMRIAWLRPAPTRTRAAPGSAARARGPPVA